MQRLHLKVRNLPTRNLQMRLLGTPSPAVPPLAPPRIALCLFLGICALQVLVVASRVARELL
jgi:hypothetical protein